MFAIIAVVGAVVGFAIVHLYLDNRGLRRRLHAAQRLSAGWRDIAESKDAKIRETESLLQQRIREHNRCLAQHRIAASFGNDTTSTLN